MFDILKSIVGWIFKGLFEEMISHLWKVVLLAIVGVMIGMIVAHYINQPIAMGIGAACGAALGLIWHFASD